MWIYADIQNVAVTQPLKKVCRRAEQRDEYRHAYEPGEYRQGYCSKAALRRFLGELGRLLDRLFDSAHHIEGSLG
jgi:hypothetical protein